jgi:hypothetical protein
VLTVAAAPFGLWLSLGGLWLRLFGTPFPGGGLNALWQWLPSSLGLANAGLAWPMIVVGTGWFGVLAGLWTRLGWSRRVGVALALVSLFHLGIGTVIGAVMLACLADRRLRSWLAASPG